MRVLVVLIDYVENIENETCLYFIKVCEFFCKCERIYLYIKSVKIDNNEMKYIHKQNCSICKTSSA